MCIFLKNRDLESITKFFSFKKREQEEQMRLKTRRKEIIKTQV